MRAAIAAAAAMRSGRGRNERRAHRRCGHSALNRDWRGIDKPTNVLSFPVRRRKPDGLPALLGDVIVAYETLAREASEENKPFLHHLAHLAVHGFLHLLGYDHETDSEAEAMEGLEREILARLGIADPYRAARAGRRLNRHA